MVARAEVSTSASSATMKDATAVTPSVQFFRCRSSVSCIAALRMVGAGVAARHRSDEWRGPETTGSKILLAEFSGILGLDQMRARPTGCLRPTGTIILAFGARHELWCMALGMVRRFNEGAVGSCLLGTCQFAHKTRQTKAERGRHGQALRRETTMRTAFWLAGVTALAFAHPAAAADTIKIGFVST